MNESMPHWLTKQAFLNPQKIAIECAEGQSFTFLQLHEKSVQFAKKLAQLGIERGSRIAVLSNNSIDMIVAIHALSYLRAVVVLLNSRLTAKELTYQLEKSKATLLLTTENWLEIKQLSFQPVHTFSEVQNLVEKDVTLAEEIILSDPFTMMFTSGTTGAPKGVIHTYGNHWFSAIGSVLNLGLHHNDKWLLTLPIFHVGGLSILIRSVLYGMTVYFIEKYEVKEIKRAFFERKVTIASLVTLMLRQLVEELEKDKLPSHVRCILLGGGSVPEPLLREVEKRDIPLFQTYGMTETSSQIATLSVTYARSKLGSAGKALAPANIKISNPDGEGIGEIIVKGPMVFEGYDNMPEENKRSFQDGWFYTGDLGYFDNDGFLYIVDRRTDLIISGGENIYPSEIEEVLLEHPLVQEAAVVGKTDEKWGKVPVAFIVSDAKLEPETLTEFAKVRLADYKVPKEIVFINQLPRNASNKVMRHRLVEKLEKSNF